MYRGGSTYTIVVVVVGKTIKERASMVGAETVMVADIALERMTWHEWQKRALVGRRREVL